MKILVFNGSPKKEKSDTLRMTRAFLDGMNEATVNEITAVDVIDKKIEYCRGCFTCMKNGGECVHDDDMRDILALMLESDIILFGFPLYCYGVPAHLKALLDRTLPLSSMTMKKSGERYEHVGKADYSLMRFVAVCGCGFPNSKNNFEPVIEEFRLMFPRGLTFIAVPESPMFSAPEAAPVTVPRLDLIKRAGKEYAEKGEIDAALLSEICSPMIPEEEYARIANGNC